jgi:hypothetical protein
MSSPILTAEQLIKRHPAISKSKLQTLVRRKRVRCIDPDSKPHLFFEPHFFEDLARMSDMSAPGLARAAEFLKRKAT